jgi:general secretion pathway protein M
MASLSMTLSPGRSRALAIALLVVAVCFGLALLIVPWLILHRHYDDAIESMTDRLERYRRVAAQGPKYRKALDALRAKDGRRFFLKNTAPNLAGAELQDMVKAAIDNNAGRLTTISITAPKDEGRFHVIGVNLQLFATTANLQKILYAIETQQPYLVVENVRLSPLNGFRGFKPAPGSEPEVNVLLDVVGYALAEADKK